ncbi:MAG: threonine/serine exporter family protein [Turicibacter sp.]|nr:threonine/serine exporter family protein [Turicibacter sp.]
MALLLQMFYAFLTCIGFSILFNVRGKIMFFAALGGALGTLAYGMSHFLGSGEVVANFFAALAISLFSEVMARVRKVPVTVLLIPGLIPFVPGGGIYFTMLHFIAGDTQNFLSNLVQTVSIAGALAFGTIILSSIVRMYYNVRNIPNRRAS